MSKIVVCSDLHAPFTCIKAIEQLTQFVSDFKPDYFVINGDAYDMYCFSNHRRSSLIIPANKELQEAKNMLDMFLGEINKYVKKQSYFLVANHERRIIKRIQEKIPELELIFKHSLFDFENVITVDEDDPKLIIDNILITHEGGKPLDNVNYFLKSCVVGHTHQPSVNYKQIENEVLFEANSGFMGDKNSPVFEYCKRKKWVNSFLAIEDGEPIIKLVR